MATHKLRPQPPLRTLRTPRTPRITRTATTSAASPHPRLRMLQRAVPVGVDGSGRGARTVPRGGPACLPRRHATRGRAVSFRPWLPWGVAWNVPGVDTLGLQGRVHAGSRVQRKRRVSNTPARARGALLH